MDDQICKTVVASEETPLKGGSTAGAAIKREAFDGTNRREAPVGAAEGGISCGATTKRESFGGSLWDDPIIEAARQQTDPQTLYTYQRSMSKTLINTLTPTPSINITDSAAQILLMLRDGLSISKLQPEERQTFIDVYGIDALNSYDSL
jgi:hypothetical protein